MNDTTSIVKLEGAARALAEARELPDILEIKDIATAAAEYARAARLGLEAQNHAAEIKLRAEYKAGRLLAELERAPGERVDLTSSNVGRGSEYKSTLDDAAVTYQDANRYQKVASIPEPEFERFIEETIDSGKELTTNKALRVVKELKKQEKHVAKTTVPNSIPPITDRYKIYHCGIEDMYSRVEPASIDYIITDPPYPKDYLSLYGELARFAVYALKPGGSLLAMCGQSYLPQVFQQMAIPSLRYHWADAYLTPGGQSAQLWDRKVNTFWKPVLWFVNGEYSGDWVGDVCKSNPNDNDKRFHHWGQSESGMWDIVSRYTYPGDVVCDPFVGGGTTAVVSILNGRLFIGCDNDESKVIETLGRLRHESA